MDAVQVAVAVHSGYLTALERLDEVAEQGVNGSQLTQSINCSRTVQSVHLPQNSVCCGVVTSSDCTLQFNNVLRGQNFACLSLVCQEATKPAVSLGPRPDATGKCFVWATSSCRHV